MGRRGMPGRRRQVLQLDENTKTSYLTQTGCYRPDDMFVESKNSAKTGLSLVGEYSDSESDTEGEAEQTEPDVEFKLNGDTQMGGEESQIVREKNDSLQAEMLELVGVKKETPADIFLREFQAYQKESVAPVYNREFIAFQKESKENVENSPTSSSKDAQKENSTKSSDDANSVTTKTDKASSSGLKAPDIDSQVASFLAEIDALGDDEEREKSEESSETGISNRCSSVDREQNAQSTMTSPDSKSKDPLNGNSATTGTSKTAKEEVDENAAAPLPPLPPQEEKIVWPEEPTTEWQQCYDENTQHCYYWNITSNEVTWEIPAEFTQYLLLYREYEEKVTKLMKEGKSKPRKKKPQKKSEKNKAKQSENESDTSSKDSSAEPQVEYGPHLPPSSNNQKDTCSSPETAGPAVSGQESSKESTEPMYGPMLKPDTLPEENKEKGAESDASSSSSTGKNVHIIIGDNMEDGEEDNIMDNKKPAAALTTSVTDAGSTSDSTAAVTVSTTSVDESSTGDSLTADLAMIELCKKKFKARMSREEESGKSSASLSVESGTKDSSLPIGFEEGLLDIDEVDRELELALERKKNELKSLEEEEEKQSHESVKVRGKRKHHNDRASDDSSADEVSTQKSSKRSRDQRSRDHKESSKHSKKAKHKKDDMNGMSSDESNPPTSKKSRSSDQKKSHRSHQSKKESRPKKVKDHDSKSRSCDDAEENRLKESALDLSQLVMDKMDFLEIDVSKQSKLQVLCIQLKTRISDWHAGGLSTKYFYVKLQEANQQLGQYEKSGAPAGWSVNWDRTCKRYFYTNNTTGHSQWEYPEPPSKEEGNELPDNLGSMAGSLPLPLLPPPPPPPSSSPSPSALEKSQEALEEANKEHQKVVKEHERRDRSSEKEKYSSSKSEGRKEKRSRKESKSSKSSRSKDSSKSKSHSSNSTCSKLKDYDCEMSIYPGEPPPPGTEPNLQPSASSVSSASIGQTNSPQLDNKDPLELISTVEDDLENVMNLAASLSKPANVCTSASGVTDEIDDMEIDPEDEVATPVPLLPPADFKINSTNTGSNGTIVSVPDAVGSHNANSSAVISKPPHLTRPAVGAESLPLSAAASGLESTLSYSGRVEATVSDTPCTSHIAFSCLPELSNESSNSPKLTDNHEASEPIKNPKEKKKKKDKVITGTSLTLKKKNVSSLVQKWQKVKKEVEKEDELARHEFSDGD